MNEGLRDWVVSAPRLWLCTLPDPSQSYNYSLARLASPSYTCAPQGRRSSCLASKAKAGVGMQSSNTCWSFWNIHVKKSSELALRLVVARSVDGFSVLCTINIVLEGMAMCLPEIWSLHYQEQHIVKRRNLKASSRSKFLRVVSTERRADRDVLATAGSTEEYPKEPSNTV